MKQYNNNNIHTTLNIKVKLSSNFARTASRADSEMLMLTGAKATTTKTP